LFSVLAFTQQGGPPHEANGSEPLKESAPQDNTIPSWQKQPKRILGMIPNYRAVSPGTVAPPPTPTEAFKIATQKMVLITRHFFSRGSPP
jgi:hypothetical protein